MSLGDSWTLTPNLEYDAFLAGRVESKTRSIIGTDLTNNQTIFQGYGVRGEIMLGQKKTGGFGWEAGPFARYWHLKTSDLDHQTGAFVEPNNYRLQTGGGYDTWPRPDILAPYGLTGRAAAITVELYVLELARRYLLAAQGELGEPLRPQAAKVLDLLYANAGRTA